MNRSISRTESNNWTRSNSRRNMLKHFQEYRGLTSKPKDKYKDVERENSKFKIPFPKKM